MSALPSDITNVNDDVSTIITKLTDGNVYEDGPHPHLNILSLSKEELDLLDTKRFRDALVESDKLSEVVNVFINELKPLIAPSYLNLTIVHALLKVEYVRNALLMAGSRLINPTNTARIMRNFIDEGIKVFHKLESSNEQTVSSSQYTRAHAAMDINPPDNIQKRLELISNIIELLLELNITIQKEHRMDPESEQNMRHLMCTLNESSYRKPTPGENEIIEQLLKESQDKNYKILEKFIENKWYKFVCILLKFDIVPIDMILDTKIRIGFDPTMERKSLIDEITYDSQMEINLSSTSTSSSSEAGPSMARTNKLKKQKEAERADIRYIVFNHLVNNKLPIPEKYLDCYNNSLRIYGEAMGYLRKSLIEALVNITCGYLGPNHILMLLDTYDKPSRAFMKTLMAADASLGNQAQPRSFTPGFSSSGSSSTSSSSSSSSNPSHAPEDSSARRINTSTSSSSPSSSSMAAPKRSSSSTSHG